MVRPSPARVLVGLVTALVSLLCLTPGAYASGESPTRPATVATQPEPVRDVAVRLVAGRTAPGPVEVGTHPAPRTGVACVPVEVVDPRRVPVPDDDNADDDNADDDAACLSGPFLAPTPGSAADERRHPPAPAGTAPGSPAGRGPPPQHD